MQMKSSLMTKNEPPVFGPNGTLLNADKMRPQNEWPKPELQGMTRGQWLSMIITMGILVALNLVNIIWKIL